MNIFIDDGEIMSSTFIMEVYSAFQLCSATMVPWSASENQMSIVVEHKIEDLVHSNSFSEKARLESC